jgi:hypothetical protein
MQGIPRFLLRMLGFTAFCAALYPLLISALSLAAPDGYVPNIRYPLNGYGHQRTRMAEVEGHGPVDIVFLGSSHAYRGFDPRIWARRGHSSFNLGSTDQSLLQTELLVPAELRDLHPKLVIIEVHPGPFRESGVESALDLIANRRIDRHTLRMALRLRHPYVWNAMAYGVLRQAAGYDERFVEPRRRKEDLYIDGGFVERTEGHFTPSESATREDADPAPLQWAAFQRVLADLRAQDIEFILVEAPMTHWMNEGIYPDRAGFDSLMHASGRYISMNRKLALDDSLHFFTKGHLNQSGVELFNEALIDTLERRGWLPEAGGADHP